MRLHGGPLDGTELELPGGSDDIFVVMSYPATAVYARADGSFDGWVDCRTLEPVTPSPGMNDPDLWKGGQLVDMSAIDQSTLHLVSPAEEVS